MDAEAKSSDIEIVELAEAIVRSHGKTWSMRWWRLLRDLSWATEVYVVGFSGR